MLKRITLFLATNLAVLVLLGIIMNVVLPMFGVRLGNNGALLVMAAVFGFGGSFISLLMSKWTAKRATGAHVIQQPGNELEQWLFTTVQRGMSAQMVRLNAATSNLANAGSVSGTEQGAYRPIRPVFAAEIDRATGLSNVRVAAVTPQDTAPEPTLTTK